MELHEAVTHLERLRDEAYVLQSKPRLGNDFRQWHGAVMETLRQIDGQDSRERRDFERISFEFPPEILQGGAERLRSELQQHGIDLPESFTIPQDDYYQKRLREAAELLFSPISALRAK
jgi:hypothetical protein